MDPTLLASFITAIMGIVIAAITARSAATKVELESLRLTIDSLTHENKRLSDRLDKQDIENHQLDLKVYALETENNALKTKNTALAAEITVLQTKVKKLEKRDTGDLRDR